MATWVRIATHDPPSPAVGQPPPRYFCYARTAFAQNQTVVGISGGKRDNRRFLTITGSRVPRARRPRTPHENPHQDLPCRPAAGRIHARFGAAIAPERLVRRSTRVLQ